VARSWPALMSSRKSRASFCRAFGQRILRPAQVDRHGNFNNVSTDRITTTRRCDAGQRRHPRWDAVLYAHDVVCAASLARVFVDKVDFISGLGHTPDRVGGRGRNTASNNLGQFDFANGVMRLIRPSSRQAIDAIQAKTGFRWRSPDAYEPSRRAALRCSCCARRSIRWVCASWNPAAAAQRVDSRDFAARAIGFIEIAAVVAS